MIKKIITVLQILILITLIFGCHNDSLEHGYNSIIFNDSTHLVEDSMKVMIQVLDKMNPQNKRFYIVDSSLYVNNDILHDVNRLYKSKKIMSYQVFNNLSYEEVVRLIEISEYLKNNFIDGIYRDKYLNIYKFMYKDSLKDTYSDKSPMFQSRGERSIIIDEKDSLIHNVKFFDYEIILDHKRSLYLVISPDYTDYLETRSQQK